MNGRNGFKSSNVSFEQSASGGIFNFLAEFFIIGMLPAVSDLQVSFGGCVEVGRQPYIDPN